MIELERDRIRRPRVDRRPDRLVAVFAIALALAFLAAAVAAALLPPAQRLGAWLPLHLATAGAASVAIAGLMPFFSAAIATTRPVPSPVRWASVVAVAVGAIGLSVGFADGQRTLAAAAGLVYLLGIALVAVATLAPARGALGPRGGIVIVGYASALAFVGIGAALATAMLLGIDAIARDWSVLKPTHAWLNTVGFVSLVIATTLLHFFPTVVGARIKRTRSAYLTVTALAVGAALAALGFALRADVLARLGGGFTLLGALALASYAAITFQARARWTGDRGWHRFATGGLVSAIAWFEVTALLAATRLLVAGADPVAAGADLLVVPFAAGWIGLAVLASATHLVPAIGPGGPLMHGIQRQRLGRAGGARLLAADLGIGSVALGRPLGLELLSAIGMGLLIAALASTTLLLAWAVVSGIADARQSHILRA